MLLPNAHLGYHEQLSADQLLSNLKLDPALAVSYRSQEIMSATPTTNSLLFVCMGNICRSPAGENVMRKLLKDAGLTGEIELDSAGTIGYHTGHSPDPRMSEAGRRRGLPMTGSARQVKPSDLQRFDLILAMDRDNYADLISLASNDEESSKIKLFCDFCSNHNASEVPDPYYGGAQGFERVLDLLEDGCTQILNMIQKERA